MGKGQHTVLIVEDDGVLLHMLTNILKAKGLNVLEAKNGREGLAQIAAQAVDLVLLDIDMPQMDGLTVLRTMKAGGSKIPVLMLTNVNSGTAIADAMELGAAEYLVKSDWEIDDIAAKVLEKLEHAHRA